MATPAYHTSLFFVCSHNRVVILALLTPTPPFTITCPTDPYAQVRRACSEVGAGRAVNCKSGKDRTALELAKAFAEEVLAAGLLPHASRAWLEAQFLRGLSYSTTSQNHGQPPAYAFNEMEILTLPAGWRPDWRLCGKVST